MLMLPPLRSLLLSKQKVTVKKWAGNVPAHFLFPGPMEATSGANVGQRLSQGTGELGNPGPTFFRNLRNFLKTH